MINASPRGKNGNTASLIEAFLEGYITVHPDAIVKYIELKNYDVKACIGCFSCWKNSKGQCIHKDDMNNLLEAYLSSDLIIWGTPLYHHGMTSLLKRFVERTLPLSLPYIVKKGDKFTHPERWSTSEKKNILISNCGFPEHHNFNIIQQSFNRIASNGLDESILCVMGELLSKKPLENVIKWYFDAVKKSGEEFANANCFSQETKITLKKALVPIENFIEMANISWEVEGESPPAIETAMGISTKASEPSDTLAGLNQLKLMKYSFNKDLVVEDTILVIKFSDVEEIYHFKINDQECKLIVGDSDAYTTKITTPLQVWSKISNGEIDASQAMLDGLYKVEGNMNFLMKMREIFGGEKRKNDISVDLENSQIIGLKKSKWMSVSFIPWIISWVTIANSSLFGITVPLVLMTIIVAIKVRYKSITYFEKMSLLYFIFLSAMEFLGITIIGQETVAVNYFSMAAIWFLSVLDKKPLTADYSKFEVSKEMRDNAIFLKTNENLTVFWSALFIVQGIIYMILKQFGLNSFAPGLYLFTIAALIYTKWYTVWYPRKVMSGSGVK